MRVARKEVFLETRTRSPARATDEGSQIQFSSAEPRDLSDLIELVRAYYRFDGISFTAAILGPALKRLLKDKTLGRVWIARDGTRPAGYVILSFNYDAEFGGLEGIVTDLFIDASYRGRGLGRRAMALVDRYCRSAGIGAVELQVERDNRAAQAFYRRLGFRKLSRIVMSRPVR
jgi:ribosomal protein S18 acetylase RimI-like enzyme